MKNVWIVIPAFNEGEVLGDVVRSAVARGFSVVVVDDGSKDLSGEIAYRAGAHVCRHPINLGQGAALQTGIDFALGHDADAVVTFDADGQHSLDDASAMVSRLARGDVDVVLGSRFRGEVVGMASSRRWLLRAATIYTRMTSGLRVTDTHNGLRCLSQRAALQIRIRQNRMAHASEILNKIGSLGLRYVEVPCTIAYTDYSRAKGQRMSGALTILVDLAMGRLYRS
ncbi:glycosyltransferase family 2 protein [Mesorhizobium sp. YIM 152430]|uniref:glycosyltransferase family 2 protein n=1 Tax=Mesorhizobium sp. YIM 152430 TaxID=3031761 RepID=UPI0023DAEEB6|nr:glycosyltransferase family 2 protein [Mesorhizobium sp. YIM 152430]MDF1599738.1 glycosyltransferase family 2 protein [Mesorhizobium sp. YIM 152430]